MRIPKSLAIATMLLLAVVIQTTLFGQLRVVAPDLVMLVVILFALTRTRAEIVLVTAFGAGLLVDLIGSSLLGLRAIVFTAVAYAALRTKERAGIGRFTTAIWVGALTLLGVILLVLVGTLFGQSSLLGPDVGTRLLVVPIANLILAAVFAPVVVRVIDGDATALRFT
ncbi:MAG: rod shape-determining protein MreD [Actinomycetota bacterium]|nr:rod shape-determining protein MreD [Actinomycetota bacterium]